MGGHQRGRQADSGVVMHTVVPPEQDSQDAIGADDGAVVLLARQDLYAPVGNEEGEFRPCTLISLWSVRPPGQGLRQVLCEAHAPWTGAPPGPM